MNKPLRFISALILLACASSAFGQDLRMQKSKATLDKLHAIILPEVRFQQAEIQEAISFLNQKSKELDPENTGVNLVLMDQDLDDVVSFDLEKVSLYQTLGLIAEMANLTIRIQDGMVVIRKAGLKE
ncbi:MAG: hypothetical protein WD708_11480 [Kiritimatiellia bacterium]